MAMKLETNATMEMTINNILAKSASSGCTSQVATASRAALQQAVKRTHSLAFFIQALYFVCAVMAFSLFWLYFSAIPSSWELFRRSDRAGAFSENSSACIFGLRI